MPDSEKSMKLCFQFKYSSEFGSRGPSGPPWEGIKFSESETEKKEKKVKTGKKGNNPDNKLFLFALKSPENNSADKLYEMIFDILDDFGETFENLISIISDKGKGLIRLKQLL